jgi:hypothetical protein
MITIYSIGSIYDDEIYVGSTCKNPWERFAEHKYNYTAGNLAVSSWKIISKSKTWGDLKLEFIEVCYDEDRMETEKYWIKNLPHVVNIYNYTADYKTYNLEYQKKNAIRLCERIECSCGKFISRKNIANHKKRPSHFFRETKNNWNKGLIQAVSAGCV